MTEVRSHLLRPDGTPIAGQQVTIHLEGAPWLDDATGQLMQAVHVVTDDDGQWSVDLTPQSEIEVTDTYYEVREHRHATSYCVVPDNGPVWLRDIIVDPDTLDPADPSADSLYVPRTEVGEPDGVAPLDSDGVLPPEHLPATVTATNDYGDLYQSVPDTSVSSTTTGLASDWGHVVTMVATADGSGSRVRFMISSLGDATDQRVGVYLGDSYTNLSKVAEAVGAWAVGVNELGLDSTVTVSEGDVVAYVAAISYTGDTTHIRGKNIDAVDQVNRHGVHKLGRSDGITPGALPDTLDATQWSGWTPAVPWIAMAE
ncbi:hypothetical protein H0B56_12040 [Haloechinothrix sp. YIM 98757]|uniref:Uncharacterized protein n=1 Tax=Haloechinothrix aidingensis TaxID=2752311 RepID=A0A838AAK1_9PSEU|nr:hypothetical protein [Haloechinothrix aidingensis]MBA0126272.1 hypothetical protein [Haloechinothrix aidingensis]